VEIAITPSATEYEFYLLISKLGRKVGGSYYVLALQYAYKENKEMKCASKIYSEESYKT
jgi:hypothetical protein